MAERRIRVAVCGASGKMGMEVVQAVLVDSELELAGISNTSGKMPMGLSELPVVMHTDLATMLREASPDVCVDFTHPAVVFENTMLMIQNGCRPIVGTTGLSQTQLQQIDQALQQQGLGGMVVPNFAIGAVLMMKFAQEAAKYFDHAEIVELHHNQKADAPSGTAIKTAEMMTASRQQFGADNAPEKELIAGSRGGKGPADIQIHSVRLPGYVASQEVLLGSAGQVLKIRHDSIDRKCFMPGVVMAVKKATALQGLVYGLENIL